VIIQSGGGVVGRFGLVAPRSVRARSGQMVEDLATMIALGGDCLADVAVVRAQPALFGSVVSRPDDQSAFRLPCRATDVGDRGDSCRLGDCSGEGLGLPLRGCRG
jgi:hypothetical protein